MNEWLLILQLASAHFGSGASDVEWATVGAYAVHESGLTTGVYRNSRGQGSALVGWTFETSSRTWAITVGAVTGYERSILPAVVPSVRIPLGDAALRVALIPPIKSQDVVGALVFAVELSF